MQFSYVPFLSPVFLNSPQTKTQHFFGSNPKNLHPCNLSKGFLDFKSSQQLWSFGGSCEEKLNFLEKKPLSTIRSGPHQPTGSTAALQEDQGKMQG